MLLVASVILPVFGIIIAGYVLVRLRILPVRLARLLSISSIGSRFRRFCSAPCR
jgi:predicted permease